MKHSLFLRFLPLIICPASLSFGQAAGQTKTMVLEAAQIQGKIKKPQVALIAVEKRPSFKPMALSSLNARRDITKSVDQSVFENRHYTAAFDIPDNAKTP